MSALELSVGVAIDRDAILSLLRIQLEEHGVELSEERLGAAVDGVLADDSRGFFLVARREARLVGIAYVSLTWSIEHGGRSAWLDELYVVPPERERGLGALMLETLLKRARALGCAAVDLEVAAGHERAANLYARKGFRPHSRARWVKTL